MKAGGTGTTALHRLKPWNVIKVFSCNGDGYNCYRLLGRDAV